MKWGALSLVSCVLMALIFSGVAGATLTTLDIVLGAGVSPSSSFEQGPMNFTVTVSSGLDSNETICHVNITTGNYTVLSAVDKANWNHYITSWGIYWNTSTSCIPSDNPGSNFRFQASSASVSSNTTSTWTVDVYNSGFTDSNSTSFTVDTVDDLSPPAFSPLSPTGNISVNESFICSVTDESWLKNATFFWNFTGTWAENGSETLSGTSGQAVFNRTGLPEETGFIWNCLACDVNDNCAFYSSNASVYVADLIAPKITISSPVETIYNYSSIWFNATLDDNGSWCGYDIGSGNVTMTKLDDFTFYGFDAAVADGLHTAVFHCNDTAGNMNSTPVSFGVDTTSPEAGMGTNPVEGFNSSSQTVQFELACSDSISGADYIELWGDWSGSWQMVQSNSSYQNGTLWAVSVGGIPEGTWSWGVFCEDSVRNSDWSDQNRTFTVDITNPLIQFEDPTPANWSEQSSTSVEINVSYTELYPDSLVLNWNGTEELMSENNLTKSGLSDGSYTFFARLNDTSGNSNQTDTREVVIDTTAPDVMLVSPTPGNGSVISGSTVTIGVYHSDRSLGSMILSLDGSNTTHSFNSSSYTNITVSISNGAHSFYVWVSDTLGNSNVTETRTFTVDNTPPPGPTGWSTSGGGGGFSGGSPACEENWTCTDWSECNGGISERVCTDANGCGTLIEKPVETKVCIVEEPEPVAKPVICEPGEFSCSGNSVVECSTDGTEWGFIANCLYGCSEGECVESDAGEVAPSITGMIIGAGSNLAVTLAFVIIAIAALGYYVFFRQKSHFKPTPPDRDYDI